MIPRALLIATFGALIAVSLSAQGPSAPWPGETADLVLRGGTVITLDANDRVAEAIAMRGARIVAVGASREIARFIGTATRVIDLRGRAVVPGFIDAHTHVESTAKFRRFWVDLHSPPLPAVRSSAAILDALRARVATVPPGTWVVGQGPFGVQIPPTAAELSAAFPDHPVVIKHSMHRYVANRKALELAHITKFTPDTPGGRIERGPDGEPTGLLDENFELFPIPYAREALKDALAKTLTEDFLQQGVTTVYELTVSPPANGLYQELRAEGRLPVRLQLGYMVYPALQPVIDLDALLAMGIHTGFGDAWLRVGPAKLFVNGAGAGVPLIRRDQALLNSTALRLHRAGWQLWVHAIGAPAQDMALEALDYVLRAEPRSDPRHRIEHIGTVLDRPRFERLKRLGVIPVPTEPALPYDQAAVNDTATVRFPYKTMLDMGLRPAGNSDTGGSVSHQMNVINRLALFVGRATESGAAYHPEESVTVTQALRILSTHGAYAGFDEADKGTLEPGKLGDCVILSGNPLAVGAERLKDLRVDATIIDGTVRYQRP